MFGNNQLKKTQNIGFLLVPEFSMIAFTASIEPLRTANRMSGKTLYTWQIFTPNNELIAASNGVTIKPSAKLDDCRLDALFVCAGLNAEKYTSRAILQSLRSAVRKGTALGSLCTGSIALAAAGLLDQYRCTIHWENIEGFVETFPELDVTATLFEIDRGRYTCSGGTAPIDMMLHSISIEHGEELATLCAEQLLHTYVRQAHDQQRMSLQYRTGITHPKLLATIAYMEAHLESPLSQGELSKVVGLSMRQLERLFHSHLDKTPTRYYHELRLKRAQALLLQTPMSIMQVAVATGHGSAAYFTKSYRDYFNRPPSAERRLKKG